MRLNQLVTKGARISHQVFHILINTASIFLYSFPFKNFLPKIILYQGTMWNYSGETQNQPGKDVIAKRL